MSEPAKQLATSLQYHVGLIVESTIEKMNTDAAAKSNNSDDVDVLDESPTPHPPKTIKYHLPQSSLLLICQLVNSYSTTLLPSELRSLAQHGKRQTVNMDDVLMMVRKSGKGGVGRCMREAKAEVDRGENVKKSVKRKTDDKGKGGGDRGAETTKKKTGGGKKITKVEARRNKLREGMDADDSNDDDDDGDNANNDNDDSRDDDDDDDDDGDDIETALEKKRNKNQSQSQNTNTQNSQSLDSFGGRGSDNNANTNTNSNSKANNANNAIVLNDDDSSDSD